MSGPTPWLTWEHKIMPNLFTHGGLRPATREEELERALYNVQRIAKDNVEYLALFPGTGLCLHALNTILNVTTPLLTSSVDQAVAKPSVHPLQMDLPEL